MAQREGTERMLSVGVRGMVMLVIRFTMGMAVFTDPLIDVTGLSRTELSMAYLLGTIGSSLFLTKAGQWYDRYGGRVMIPIASLCLGVMVTFISSVDYLTGLLGGGAFVLMLLGYFGVRFFGQGILTSCSRNVLILWFAKRRGLVSGLRSMFVSFGFSIAPLLLASLIALYDWRGALWCLGIMVLIYAAIALVFIRDNPASIGVTAVDGTTKLIISSSTSGTAGNNVTFKLSLILISSYQSISLISLNL